MKLLRLALAPSPPPHPTDTRDEIRGCRHVWALKSARSGFASPTRSSPVLIRVLMGNRNQASRGNVWVRAGKPELIFAPADGGAFPCFPKEISVGVAPCSPAAVERCRRAASGISECVRTVPMVGDLRTSILASRSAGRSDAAHPESAHCAHSVYSFLSAVQCWIARRPSPGPLLSTATAAARVRTVRTLDSQAGQPNVSCSRQGPSPCLGLLASEAERGTWMT